MFEFSLIQQKNTFKSDCFQLRMIYKGDEYLQRQLCKFCSYNIYFY